MKRIFLISLFIILCSVTAPAARYWAEVDANDDVLRVIACDDPTWPARVLGGTWHETFMNDPDKNYAGKGHKWNPNKTNYHGDQPYPSWSLDDKLKWQPPVPMPKDNKRYRWDEPTVGWIEITKIKIPANEIAGGK